MHFLRYNTADVASVLEGKNAEPVSVKTEFINMLKEETKICFYSLSVTLKQNHINQEGDVKRWLTAIHCILKMKRQKLQSCFVFPERNAPPFPRVLPKLYRLLFNAEMTEDALKTAECYAALVLPQSSSFIVSTQPR